MGCVPAPWAGADSYWLSATRDLALQRKTTPPTRDPPTHPPILPQASRPRELLHRSPARTSSLLAGLTTSQPEYTLTHWCNPLGAVPQPRSSQGPLCAVGIVQQPKFECPGHRAVR